jgi:hypothetical protein
MVTARTPMALNAGAGLTNQSIAAANSTALYKYTSPADNYVATLGLSGLGAGLLPVLVAAPRVIGNLAPTTGRFAEGLPFDTSGTVTGGTMLTARNTAVYLPKAGDYYFALYTDNLSGSAAHSYTLTLKAAAGTKVSLVEPPTPDSAASPVASITVNAPFYAIDGAIDFAGDVDYIRFQPGAGGRVYASAATPSGANIAVGLYAMDCVTPLSIFSTSRVGQGASSQEEAVNMGNVYCARVSGPDLTAYQLTITQDLP